MYNKIKSKWSINEKVINSWLSIPSSFSAEIIASIGFDSVTIDMQHGMIDFQTSLSMLQSISAFDVTPLIRIPSNEPGIIMKSLDAGAQGLICPMINDSNECESFVRSCKYAPQGNRSFGPSRARIHVDGDYFNQANNNILTFAMIETKQGVDNLDSILSVEGLDAIYIGPSDLSISLGVHPLEAFKSSKSEEVIKYILHNAQSKNIKAGIHCPNGSVAYNQLKLGFDFATISADAVLLSNAVKSELDITNKIKS